LNGFAKIDRNPALLTITDILSKYCSAHECSRSYRKLWQVLFKRFWSWLCNL